jgi:hypothetical protein
VNYAHLLIGLGITAWVISVEYRLWANLRILNEQLKVGQKRGNLSSVSGQR